MLKAGVCHNLLKTLNKEAKEGDRTVQPLPHTPEGTASTVVVTQRDIEMAAEAFAKKVMKNFQMGILNKLQWFQTTVQISYEGELKLICEGMDRQMAREMPECQATSSKSCLNSVKTVHSCWVTGIVTDAINLGNLEMDIRRIFRSRPDLPRTCTGSWRTGWCQGG
jgi:hypothetical protein